MKVTDIVANNILFETSNDGKCIRLTVSDIGEEPKPKNVSVEEYKTQKIAKPNFFKRMIKKIFKPIKRFWRGLTGRMRVIALLLLSAALILVGVGVYLIARPGESSEEGVQLLFSPGVERAEIAEVRAIVQALISTVFCGFIVFQLANRGVFQPVKAVHILVRSAKQRVDDDTQRKTM